MDAKYSTGDDNRDTLAADLEERCPSCGVHPDDPREPGCTCTACENAAERQWAQRGDGLTADERAAVERDQMAVAQRLKR